MSTTGDLIPIGECEFCGQMKHQWIFHTCSTAPKFVPFTTNRVGISRSNSEELTPEEEKAFYKKVFKTELI